MYVAKVFGKYTLKTRCPKFKKNLVDMIYHYSYVYIAASHTS